MLDFHIDLSRLCDAAERIATALERAVGPGFIPPEGTYKKRGPESIVTYGGTERSWLKEQTQGLLHEKGLAPAMEQEILNEALAEYDQSVENQALDPYGDPL